MNWNAVGAVATALCVIAAFGAWFWPRRRRRKGDGASRAHTAQTVGSGVTIIGNSNVVNSRSDSASAPPHRQTGRNTPAAPNSNLHTISTISGSRLVTTYEFNESEIATRPHARITLEEFSRLLRDANSFRKKELIAHYKGKNFLVKIHIDDVQEREDGVCATGMQSGVLLSVYFPHSRAADILTVRDSGWWLECEAELLTSDVLTPDEGDMWFYRAVKVRVSPTIPSN